MEAKKQAFLMYRTILIRELELIVEAGMQDLRAVWKRDNWVKSA